MKSLIEFMNETKTLYIDLDGVLVDFESQANRILPGLFSAPGVWADITPDQWKALEKEPDFWLSMKPMPGAVMFWNLLNQAGWKPQILSAAGGTDKAKCEFHKLTWCLRELPNFDPLMFNCVHKSIKKQEFCTGKNSILVDDYRLNIEQWKAKGGTGILHHGNVYDTLRKIRQLYRHDQL